MSIKVPPQPEFGEALPVEAHPEVLAFLARRRSASAFTLRAPGPSAEEVDTLLRLAARVPDHGKLSPWRFLVIEGAAKAAVGEKLAGLTKTPKEVAALGKFNAPPLCIGVISRTVAGEIPEWEQILSAGAVCDTLLNAASAMGFGANWITDWYSQDEAALALFGVESDEKVAGFVFVGTASEAPLERVRPDMGKITTRL